MIVIADSTPLNYLILIHQVDLLPRLFDRILIPPAVFEELQHQETPDVVRRWIAGPPSWLQVQALSSVPDPTLGFLDAGEREAIALAEELQADQLLLDDADARREAARSSGDDGLDVSSTAHVENGMSYRQNATINNLVALRNLD